MTTRQALLSPSASLGLLIAFKPNFAIWAVLIFLGGFRRAGAGALVAAGGFTLLALLVDGPGVVRQWLAATPTLAQAGAGMARIGGNLSFVAIFGRFDLTYAGFVLSLVLAAAACSLARIRRYSLSDLNSLGLVCCLFLGPVTWVGYSILLLPCFFSGRWSTTKIAAAALLCVPAWLVERIDTFGPHAQLAAESVYAIGVLFLLVSLLPAREKREGVVATAPATQLATA
jgi:hypothetical protein